MPNVLDATGLQTATTAEQTSAIEQALKAVYGSDIDLASNSPDGQLIGIFVQAMQDLLDLLTNIFNMFSVDSASGVLLQRLVAVNGLALRPGAYTTTPVSITVDRAVTLYGLDQEAQVQFAVRDSNNVWTLLSTYSFGGAGTQALVFQCDVMGNIVPLPNTIIQITTPTLGVTDSNNPTVAGTVAGQVEETDVELRRRHGSMFKLAATGPFDAVQAALLAIPSVADALVVENATGAPVSGQPAHSIWAIVVGGTGPEIGQAIYSKKAPGCEMYGALSEVVTRPNGQTFTAKYDVGVEQQLWAQFGVLSKVAGITFDKPLIAQQMAAAMDGYFKLNQSASIGDLAQVLAAVEPRAIMVSAGVSTDGMAFSDNVSPTSPKYYFTIDAADIDIS
jgi:hypothetical protein